MQDRFNICSPVGVLRCWVATPQGICCNVLGLSPEVRSVKEQERPLDSLNKVLKHNCIGSQLYKACNRSILKHDYTF